MNRPDIEKIEKQLKRGTGYRRMQGTALSLIAWIKQLETEKLDLTATGNLISEMKKELSELRNIGEEFIERRDKGQIRSTYTYNRFRRALGKDDSGDLSRPR